MGPIGLPELLVIMVLALLLFGPRKLPEIGRSIGKAVGEFKRASDELKRTLNAEIALEEEGTVRPRYNTSPT
ncbi:MAG TPA: twin-arginine translocase TatA/TatE family subunit, partial [Thermoanaerobaculia bacterium]|nr:twin-arginine translocase TatA/TatE family subunit [Thermoanaerobaculia bacterium]